MSYIVDIQVSLNADQEHEYRSAGYLSVPSDLNKGTGGPKIYLWYQRGSDRNAAITRIQFSFNDMMSESLKNANYTKIDKNLNEGPHGDKIYLWYFKGSTTKDVPIIDLHVTTQADDEPGMFGLGWKRLACDLNRNNAGRNRIHLWVMQEEQTYISDFTATKNSAEDATYFNQGFIRLDEDTNRGVDAAPNIFMFYRLTKSPTEAVKDVKISASEVTGYTKVEQDLNEGTGGSPLFLWYSIYASNHPIQDLTLIDSEALDEYENAKIPVIDQNINPKGAAEYVSYYQ